MAKTENEKQFDLQVEKLKATKIDLKDQLKKVTKDLKTMENAKSIMFTKKPIV